MVLLVSHHVISLVNGVNESTKILIQYDNRSPILYIYNVIGPHYKKSKYNVIHYINPLKIGSIVCMNYWVLILTLKARLVSSNNNSLLY